MMIPNHGLFFALLLSFINLGDGQLSLEEQNWINNLEKWHQGYCRLIVSTSAGDEVNEVEYEIWFDGGNIAGQIKYLSGILESTSTKYIKSQQLFARCRFADGQQLLNQAVEIKEPVKTQLEDFPLFDPRVIASCPCPPPIWYRRKIRDCLGGLRQEQESVEKMNDEEFGECDVVKFVAENGNQIEIWFSASSGNLVRFKTYYRRPGIELIDEAFYSYKDLKPFEGMVFPSLVTFSRSENGEETLKSIASVLEVNNSKIDATLFSLAGLGLRKGSTVLDHSGKFTKEFVWDGETTVQLP